MDGHISKLVINIQKLKNHLDVPQMLFRIQTEGLSCMLIELIQELNLYGIVSIVMWLNMQNGINLL